MGLCSIGSNRILLLLLRTTTTTTTTIITTTYYYYYLLLLLLLPRASNAEETVKTRPAGLVQSMKIIILYLKKIMINIVKAKIIIILQYYNIFSLN